MIANAKHQQQQQVVYGRPAAPAQAYAPQQAYGPPAYPPPGYVVPQLQPQVVVAVPPTPLDVIHARRAMRGPRSTSTKLAFSHFVTTDRHAVRPYW